MGGSVVVSSESILSRHITQINHGDGTKMGSSCDDDHWRVWKWYDGSYGRTNERFCQTTRIGENLYRRM